ncbi:nucleotidyltransferase family protein [Francisellaceae bacterium]|nr:nucleotidyltransferase family protein [Francisellaceae bacterium]
MKAMILAAGRGSRMKALTNETPKPLLEVNQKSLIEHQIIKLRDAGFYEIVINVAYLGQKIIDHLQFGDHLGVNIQYSYEGDEGLETGGGIRRALSLLTDEFIVVNADVMTDFSYKALLNVELNDSLAYLILVKNPVHNLNGDFGLSLRTVQLNANGLNESYTFSGIGLYSKELFSSYHSGETFSLLSVLKPAIEFQKVLGSVYTDSWDDIGTPERLQGIRRA